MARQPMDGRNRSGPRSPLRSRCPRPPSWLSEEAKVIWRGRAPDLYRIGALDNLAADVFALYCEMLAKAVRASHLVSDTLLARGRRDAVVTNPAWRIFRDATFAVRGLAHDLGRLPGGASEVIEGGGASDPSLPLKQE